MIRNIFHNWRTLVIRSKGSAPRREESTVSSKAGKFWNIRNRGKLLNVSIKKTTGRKLKVRMGSSFSTETLENWREWSNVSIKWFNAELYIWTLKQESRTEKHVETCKIEYHLYIFLKCRTNSMFLSVYMHRYEYEE